MGCAFNVDQKLSTNAINGHRNRFATIDARRKSTKVVDKIIENAKMITQDIDQSQTNFCMESLKKHPLFSELTKDELETVCSAMVRMKGQKNEYLFKQGQPGHSFFLIQSGQVSVQVDGSQAAKLQKCQAFGELALLFRTKRSASIKCTQQSYFFVMKPMQYRQMLAQLKTTQYTRNKQIVQRITLLQCLTNKQKYNLANSIQSVHYQAGAVVFSQGDVSTGLYLVSEGAVEIRIKGKEAITVGELEMFGESALKDGGRRQGDARCIQTTTLLVIGRKDIQRALGASVNNLVFYNIQRWALMRVQPFKKYSSNDLNRIIMGFTCQSIKDKQQLKGDQYKGLMISLQGKINDQPEGSMFNLEQWQKGQQLGENLIKNGAGNIAYISFDKLNQIIEGIQNRQQLFKASQKCIQQRDEHISLNDFDIVKKLGQGQFGQVYMVINKKAAGSLYAVKCLSKQAVIQQQMQQSVIQQKTVLQKAIFPYIVGFVKSFHDSKNIFLLMQYLRGKQMFDVIREMTALSKPIVRYFFGCILLSIQYLHANSIIYRDVKPQNSVIDYRGKVHLIDLGTAKELKGGNNFKTFTVIGTPHYMAPQVFEGKGYSFQVDYWSLGILLYQFVCGRLPFGQNILDNPYKLYKIIDKGILQFPKYITDQKAKNLIRFMLKRNPAQRSQQVTFEKIKKHQYFEGFRWDDLLQEKMVPPYIPRDFRQGKEELLEEGGSFLKHLYGDASYGSVREWNGEFTQ